MKAIKYLFIAALTAGYSANATAQDGSKADIAAVKNIISSKPADLDKQMKPYYKANKKNAENLVAFGRAFYEVKDTANARVYANYALQASKNKFAPAYVLLGDVEVMGDNGGGAASQYEQAIYVDPKNPDAYYKYALINRKVNPGMVAQKLDELKAQRPDIDVDAIKGHICAISKDDKGAFESYSKANIANLDRSQLVEFASACFFTGKHADGLRVVKEAVKKYPRYATFNRLGMMFSVELQNYQEGLQFADRLFNASDSLKAHNQEYFYQGLAHNGLKNYDKAIESFEKALSIKSDGNLVGEASILKSIADAHKANGNFDEAANYLRRHISKKEKPTFNDHEDVAKLFQQQARDTTLTQAAREAALAKADAAYDELGQKFENNLIYVLYQRANIGMQLDPELQKGTALPHYAKIIEIVEPKADRDKGETQILRTAYHYMMSRSLLIDKDKAKAKDFANKILAIDPEYAPAKAVVELK